MDRDEMRAAVQELADSPWLFSEEKAALTALLVREQALTEALGELHAAVRGECPSLLNEDSGGDAELALQIESLLSGGPR